MPYCAGASSSYKHSEAISGITVARTPFDFNSMRQIFQFRAGDWVEVRSEAQILATLDEQGRLDALPFMPEMLQYCGKRFRVGKTAHKTCDTIQHYKARHMERAVHLEGLRCDGQSHGGCQAGCLLFWKTAWLEPVNGSGDGESDRALFVKAIPAPPRCNRAALLQSTRVHSGESTGAEDLYACQATELLRATATLKWWDPRQYLMDLISGNVGFMRWVRYIALAGFNALVRLRWPSRQVPAVVGRAVGKTPTETLDIKPGEWVRVRSPAEIMETLSAGQKNRGLWFDVEMLPFCEKRFQVLHRVEKIVDEKTGKLITLPGGCLILDGVTCSGNYSHDRLFCPRAIYPYWREIWLRRTE